MSGRSGSGSGCGGRGGGAGAVGALRRRSIEEGDRDDVEHDGDIDVVVANVRGQNELYLNDGSGTEWTRKPIGEESYVTYGVATADLNGDGFADLGFANSSGPNVIFLNVEAGPNP